MGGRAVRPRLVSATVATALILGVGMSGCAGRDDNNSGQRPTIEAMISSIKATSKVDDSYATCLAESLFNSRLPNGVVRKLAQSQSAQVDSDSKAGYENTIEEIKSACAAMQFMPG